eukprot:1194025-Prorocentrum_minimum.AAC.2
MLRAFGAKGGSVIAAATAAATSSSSASAEARVRTGPSQVAETRFKVRISFLYVQERKARVPFLETLNGFQALVAIGCELLFTRPISIPQDIAEGWLAVDGDDHDVWPVGDMSNEEFRDAFQEALQLVPHNKQRCASHSRAVSVALSPCGIDLVYIDQLVFCRAAWTLYFKRFLDPGSVGAILSALATTCTTLRRMNVNFTPLPVNGSNSDSDDEDIIVLDRPASSGAMEFAERSMVRYSRPSHAFPVGLPPPRIERDRFPRAHLGWPKTDAVNKDGLFGVLLIELPSCRLADAGPGRPRRGDGPAHEHGGLVHERPEHPVCLLKEPRVCCAAAHHEARASGAAQVEFAHRATNSPTEKRIHPQEKKITNLHMNEAKRSHCAHRAP